MSKIIPKKLAIYYGYPSSVNATYTVSGAAAVFSAYDMVVFGEGLENETHPDHINTINIIADPTMANTEVYGYIDATIDLSIIQDRIDKWYAMGVKGIFCDRFGYDFGVTREKQRQIVWSIHEKANNRLKAFVNAFNPDDAFSPNIDATYNPDGLPTRLNNRDWYLAESFAVIDGAYDDNDLDANGIKDWQDKALKMSNYRSIYKTKMAAVATQGNLPFDQNKADYSYFAAVLNKFDAWAWGEENYSSLSAQLPFRERKSLIGTQFSSQVLINNDVYQRRTNVGIHIDTVNHTVDVLLD
ncbi:hypothetical protein QJ856_gp0351 [Tupanvirus deep ocean]|uniref:Uncharacterized protein n=1 Tax=Tupanvirus soda lake TaxID=2126985 RepID=A0AC59HBX0_9VIRU|nr:hypothetical protein QJ856_gp0351 [Tupanvirus deep ocean]AUL79745.2 hypothetical protein [Tupanvirus deep ocean]